MTKASVRDKLREVKLAQAAKYASLAKISGSIPKRQAFLHSAERYRQQAAKLAPRQAG